MWFSIGYLLCAQWAYLHSAADFAFDGCECLTLERDYDDVYRVYSSVTESCEEDEEVSSHE